MDRTRWDRLKALGGRGAAATPAVVAALGVAMAASSTPRPDMDRTAEAVARLTGGELSEDGLNIVRDVWYLWTPAAGTARIRTCGGDETLVRGAGPQLGARPWMH